MFYNLFELNLFSLPPILSIFLTFSLVFFPLFPHTFYFSLFSPQFSFSTTVFLIFRISCILILENPLFSPMVLRHMAGTLSPRSPVSGFPDHRRGIGRRPGRRRDHAAPGTLRRGPGQTGCSRLSHFRKCDTLGKCFYMTFSLQGVV